MQGFNLAFGVVVPLIVYMGIGMLIRALGLFSEDSLKEMNTVIFKVFIPLSLFFDIYSADLGSVVDAPLFLWTAGLITASFVIALLICKKTIPDRADVPTVAQGIYRSNTVLFGTVISRSIAGETGAAIMAALFVMVVPLLNILAVIDFEVMRGGKVDMKKTLWQIVKNPLVLAGILGGLVNLSGLRLPELICQPLVTLGDLASPLALVVLGAMLSFKSMVSHRGRLLAAVFCKLVTVPVICIGIMALLGYRGPTMAAILAIYASPTAVASTPMAQTLGGNVNLAGEIVALTTVFSVMTVFLFTAVMSNLGMF